MKFQSSGNVMNEPGKGFCQILTAFARNRIGWIFLQDSDPKHTSKSAKKKKKVLQTIKSWSCHGHRSPLTCMA